MSFLEINNLNFSYGEREILKSISFSIGRDERWAILGKNGSGKSTLLKCICRLNKLKSPEVVLLNNKSIYDYTTRELASFLAYVPQTNGMLPPPFTVRDYVLMGRYHLRGVLGAVTKRDIKAASRALHISDTLYLEGRMMNSLSGGELQRAYMAGAVAQSSAMLLLDEPTAFLDPLHQENISIALDRIYKELGAVYITVTHDVNFALAVHSHILALVDGKVLFAGEKEQFLKRADRLLCEIYSVPFENAITGDQKRYFICRSLL